MRLQINEAQMDKVSRITPECAQQCSCSKSANGSTRVVKWTTAGGLLAALGVCAACCLLPFALLSLGIASAWAGMLDALTPYKWIFIGLTAALLGYGFYTAYWRPRRTCAAGPACEICGTSRSVRVGLWVATILAIGGIVFERVEPYLAR
jgi:mercuric ion transport protein